MEDIATTLRVIHQMMTTQWDSMVQFFIKRLKVIYQEQLVTIESPKKEGKIDSKHTIGFDGEMKEGVRELVRRCGEGGERGEGEGGEGGGKGRK